MKTVAIVFLIYAVALFVFGWVEMRRAMRSYDDDTGHLLLGIYSMIAGVVFLICAAVIGATVFFSHHTL